MGVSIMVIYSTDLSMNHIVILHIDGGFSVRHYSDKHFFAIYSDAERLLLQPDIHRVMVTHDSMSKDHALSMALHEWMMDGTLQFSKVVM